MTLSGLAAGAFGAVGINTESIPGGTGTPGTFVAAGTDDWLYVDAPPTLSGKFDMEIHETLGQTRDSEAAQTTGQSKTGGALSWPLYINMGQKLLVAALGTDTYMTAIASDTAATIATTGGVSTITLTTGGGAYTVGAFVTIDAGASQELRRVLSWASGPKTMTVAALAKSHGATPAVVQIAQHHYIPFTFASGFANLLRTVSVEEQIGGEYAEQYPNMQVGKLSVKAQKGKIATTADLMGSAARSRPGSMTTFATTSQTTTDLRLFYQFKRSYLVAGADQAASGTATTQLISTAESWDVDLNNDLQEIGLPGNESYSYFPGGKRQVMINYAILNSANRPAIYEDFLSQNTEMPWFADVWQNTGTTSAPTWRGVGFYAPNVHVHESDELRPFDKPIGESVKAQAVKRGSANILEMFALTDTAVAY